MAELEEHLYTLTENADGYPIGKKIVVALVGSEITPSVPEFFSQLFSLADSQLDTVIIPMGEWQPAAEHTRLPCHNGLSDSNQMILSFFLCPNFSIF